MHGGLVLDATGWMGDNESRSVNIGGSMRLGWTGHEDPLKRVESLSKLRPSSRAQNNDAHSASVYTSLRSFDRVDGGSLYHLL